ncbi:Shedu anti-phage system protein SduA domain-containing protein [Nocardia rosealba]|uniref:Shedu anti-phage system protein SduA domain-containing protein n=1 Tax=Nocardia rosealba TaxID=2878563 RepID=UPI001CD9E62F|nr:Shedu anti-phage system protein SduA domain-containing protein [Nocardia rosealba]MCA2210562.1 DUF4263 domain-containing protein [Nocardia rosealba]
MNIRADWPLELVLERAAHESASVEVKDAIDATVRHLNSGKGRQRRGGKALIRSLEVARLRACEESEWHTVQLVQDAHDYCTGRTLRPVLEERFRLFQDAGRREINRGWVAGMFAAVAQGVESMGRAVLEKGEAHTAAEFFAALTSALEDGKFVDAPTGHPGRYRIVRGTAETALWLERVFRDRIDVEDAADAARRIVMTPEALTLLANEDAGLHLFKAVELKRKSQSLTAIRRVIDDISATETDLQRLIQAQPWMFGGSFLAASVRRRLVPGDEMDIPLLRGDGSLHVVELKRAMSAHILKRHRGAWVPTAEVHDAAAQAINYLVGLDENRERIRTEFGIETRRSSAVVVIGHPAAHPDVSEETVADVLRTFNSHMCRVDVMTYKELIDSAERALGYDTRTMA